jgi:4-hydroxy-2-oxoheptanedioate aldolase
MDAVPRLNKIATILEQGGSVFVNFAPPEISAAIATSEAPYDGVVFEMEHNPLDINNLRHCL